MEHIALYRQFRPQTFDDIVEQETAVTTLRQTVISQKIGHAYLFCGTRGTGKTTIAKVFSRAINCEHPVNGNPCNECDTCRGILNGSLMDVIEMDAASNNSVDNIRRICEEVVYTPSKAPYKVYIIDEVHMLSNGAFNALLKTLEEPPQHAVFLLATTEPHKIPPTILSRCQRYDFKRITQDAIIKRLEYICTSENIKFEKDALTLIASLSDGALRDSISLLDQAQAAAEIALDGSKLAITAESVEKITGTVDVRFMNKYSSALLNGDYESLITLSDELFKSGADLTRFAIEIGGYLRDLLIVRMVPDPTSIVHASSATLKSMYDLATTVSAETLVAFISYISNLVSELKWTPCIKTTFEISMIRLCGRKVKADVVPLVIPDFANKQAVAAKEISNNYGSLTNSVSDDITNDSVTQVADVISETLEQTTDEPTDNIFDEMDNNTSCKSVADDNQSSNQLDLLAFSDSATQNNEDNVNEDNVSLDFPEDKKVSVSNIEKNSNNSSPLSKFVDGNYMLNKNVVASNDKIKEDTSSVSKPKHKTMIADVFESQSDLPLFNQQTDNVSKANDIEQAQNAPSDIDAMWHGVLSQLQNDDYPTYLTFSVATVMTTPENKMYIIFEEANEASLKELTRQDSCKKLTRKLKLTFPGYSFFLCTRKQYDSFAKSGNIKYADSNSKPNISEYLANKNTDITIDTDLHFGDN